jgi:hypothetical protein
MKTVIKAVFRIRILRINMLLGLTDPGPLAQCMDSDPDPLSGTFCPMGAVVLIRANIQNIFQLLFFLYKEGNL